MRFRKLKCERDDQQKRDVYAFEIATKREHNLTESPFNEMRGALTQDGRTLVFVSDRADGVNHLFVVSVERLAEDPDDPLVKERLKKAQAEREEAKDPAVPVFRVNAEGIRCRAVRSYRPPASAETVTCWRGGA